MGAGSVTSIEIDEDAVTDLQDNLEEFELEEVSVIQADVNNLPFRLIPDSQIKFQFFNFTKLQ